MVRVTEWKISAFNILDYIFIHDLASMSTFSDLKNEFYGYVADEIDTINSQRGFTEYRAEVYKHYLLCGIELKLNQVFESRFKRIIDEVLLRVKSSGFPVSTYLQDVLNICGHSNISCLDGTVKYKLLAQFLYFDFDSASMSFFNKLLELKILSTGRLKEDKMSPKHKEEMNRVFLRVLMFCEFEILKKQIIHNYSNMFMRLDFNDIINGNVRIIKDLLVLINKEINHEEMIFHGDVRNVSALAGAFFFIEGRSGNVYKNKKQVNYRPDYNIPINSLYVCKTKAVHDLNDKKRRVCTEYAQNKMKEYGFEFIQRTFYDNSVRLYSFYKFMHNVFDYTSKYGVWYYNFIDQLCYDDRYPEIYKTGLRQAIDGLQMYKPKKE
mgnify:FL=1